MLMIPLPRKQKKKPYEQTSSDIISLKKGRNNNIKIKENKEKEGIVFQSIVLLNVTKPLGDQTTENILAKLMVNKKFTYDECDSVSCTGDVESEEFGTQ